MNGIACNRCKKHKAVANVSIDKSARVPLCSKCLEKFQNKAKTRSKGPPCEQCRKQPAQVKYNINGVTRRVCLTCSQAMQPSSSATNSQQRPWGAPSASNSNACQLCRTKAAKCKLKDERGQTILSCRMCAFKRLSPAEQQQQLALLKKSAKDKQQQQQQWFQHQQQQIKSQQQLYNRKLPAVQDTNAAHQAFDATQLQQQRQQHLQQQQQQQQQQQEEEKQKQFRRQQQLQQQQIDARRQQKQQMQRAQRAPARQAVYDESPPPPTFVSVNTDSVSSIHNVPTLPRTDQMRAPTNKLPESNTAYDSVDSYTGTYQNLILSPIDDDNYDDIDVLGKRNAALPIDHSNYDDIFVNNDDLYDNIDIPIEKLSINTTYDLAPEPASTAGVTVTAILIDSDSSDDDYDD